MNINLFYSVEGFVLFLLLLLNLRNGWVYRNRRKWVDKDVYHFREHAPTYSYMIWHFWIWDMHKFGMPE